MRQEILSSNGEVTGKFLQVGIRAPQGTLISINKNNDPVQIGPTGIYEIDLRNKNTFIFSLNFTNLNNILSNGQVAIVDLIEEGM